MRSSSLLVAILLITTLAVAQQPTDRAKRPLPSPVGAVNDFGHFLSPKEIKDLGNELASYHKATTNAIVILTLDSLPTDPVTKKQSTIEETASRYFNTWGIGDSIKNNGVLIVAIQYTRQVRIEVGLGLEKILTNDICLQIITQHLVPRFKEGKFFAGFQATITALKEKLEGAKNKAELDPQALLKEHIVESDDGAIKKVQLIAGAFIGLIVLGGLFLIIRRSGKNNNTALASNQARQADNDDNNPYQPQANDAVLLGTVIAAGGIDSPPPADNSPAVDNSPSFSADSFDGGSSDGGGASGDS